MKKAELAQRVLDGELIVGVEYRGATCQRLAASAEYKTAETAQIRHRIEMKDGKQQEVVEKFTPEQMKDVKDIGKFVEDWNKKPLPFKKGSRVLWHVKSYAWTQRGQKASGHLENLED